MRIEPSLHKELALMAGKKGESLNSLVEEALKSYAFG
ncbi:MAG: toxin-antitoxin system HicB family antitoxin [Lachnospiraceae bacterium]|nr:toxin-antitoxin system HicB family antitoxin [Lachnospiraceae bacterium]